MKQHEDLPTLEAETFRLREIETERDIYLCHASAATKAAPDDVRAAARHLECADRLAVVARERERAEEALLAALRL
jgi:hypothetical protein